MVFPGNRVLLSILCITLSWLSVKAQNIPEQVFWLKPSNLTPNPDNKIESWNSTINDIEATQPQADNQPVYNPNLLNGTPGIDLNGSQFLSLPDNIDFISGNKTILVLYRPDESYYSVLAKGRAISSNSQNGDFAIVPFSGDVRVRWQENDQLIVIDSPNLAAGNFYFMRIEIDRGSGVGALYINEELKGSTICSSNYSLGNTSRPTFVGSYMSAPTVSLNGAIAEVGLFSFANDEEKLDQILVDLGSRYLPNIDLGEDVVLQPGESCSFDLSVADIYDSIRWSTGATTSEISITEPGEYFVVATGDYGFKVSDTIRVGFEENLIPTENLLCSYDSLEWDLGLASGYSYTWSDGLETSESSRFLQPGNSYSVEISNGNCSITTPVVNIESDSYSETVELTENPNFCLGNELYLSSGFAEAETYIWSTGEETAFVSPTGSGTYWVEATNANGCVGRDTVEVVIAGAAPVVEFTNGTACEANAVVFTDQTDDEGSGIINQTWVAVDALGVDSLQGGVVEYTFPATGSYPIELTVLLANGCSGTGRDTIQVNPLPLVGFNFDTVIPCAGNEVAYESASGVPGDGTITGYAWSFGNGSTDTGIVGTTVFEEMGVNTVQLAVTTSAGCVDSLMSNVVVLGSPVADFNWEAVCVGMPTVLEEDVDTSESGPVFYNWQFGDGYFSNFPNTSHVYAQAGVYDVQLTATGNDFGGAGCVDKITKQVRVYAPPAGAATAGDGCLGDAVLFTDLTQPVVLGGVADFVESREWVLPFGYGQGPISVGGDSVQVWLGAEAGNYLVSLHFETEAGCTGSASANVDVLGVPEASFVLSVPEVAPPVVAVPENTSTDAEGYVWLVNGEVVSTDAEPELAFADSGMYSVMLVATNSLGCNDTTVQEVAVIDPVYDLGLVDIRYTVSGSRLALRAVLANNGNVPIRQFRMAVQLGLSGNTDQMMDFEIAPGEVKEFTLPQDFEYLASRDLPYVCITVGVLPLVEVDLENNALCIGLEKERVVFIDPYPNPGSGLFKLGTILPVPGRVTLRVIDSEGRELKSVFWDSDEGYSLHEVDLRDLSEGSYFLRYSFGGEEVVKRVVLSR